MTERNKFIKVRVSEREHADLRRRADARGVTVSEHVREVVAAVHESLDVNRAIAEMRAAIDRLVADTSVKRQSGDEGRELEVLLLLRELAAARDAQILNRVRAQVAARTHGVQQGGQR